jgi:hypothetical protein
MKNMIDNPKIPMLTTDIPMTAPPRNATRNPELRLCSAAAAVRQLAFTATLMPIQPARPEQIAPKTKAIDTDQPRLGTIPKIMATRMTKTTNIRYSRFRKARAPSWIAPLISRIVSFPASCLITNLIREIAKINPATPITVDTTIQPMTSSFFTT